MRPADRRGYGPGDGERSWTTLPRRRNRPARSPTAPASRRGCETDAKTVTVGGSSFSLNPGQTSPITLKLNAAGLKLLSKTGSLPVSVTIVETDPTGKKITKVVNFTIKAVETKKKPKHGKKRH